MPAIGTPPQLGVHDFLWVQDASDPVAGHIYYDAESELVKYFDGTSWLPVISDLSIGSPLTRSLPSVPPSPYCHCATCKAPIFTEDYLCPTCREDPGDIFGRIDD